MNDEGEQKVNAKLSESLGTPDLTLEDLEAEARAEEEFISNKEDEIENPLVYGEDNKLHLESELKKSEESDEEKKLSGAIGTGNLETEGLPFNNEQALREEKMNDNNNPLNNENTEHLNPDMDFGANTNDAQMGSAPSIDVVADAGTVSVDAEVGDVSTEGGEPKEVNAELSAEMDAMLSEAGPDPVMNMGAEVTDAPVESVESEVIAPANETVAPADNVSTVSNGQPTIADLANGVANPTTPENTNNANTQAAKPKKKTGLIIGAIVAVLLVIGGGVGALAYVNWHESAENVFADALEYLWDAKNIQANGTMNLVGDDSDGFKSASIKFELVNTDSASSINISELKITGEDDKEYTLSIGAAYSLDDATYLKVDGLTEAIDGAVTEEDDDLSSLNGVIASLIGNIIEVIDDKWIKIDSESLSQFGELKNTYDCFQESAKATRTEDFKQKVADIYSKNSFMAPKKDVVETRDNMSIYEVVVNKDAGKKFSEEVEALDEVVKLNACFEDMEDSGSSLSIDLGIDDTDEEAEEEEDAETTLLVGITGWDHIPKEITIKRTSGDETEELKMSLDYEEKAVELPGEAITIEELTMTLQESMKGLYLEIIEAQLATQCSMMYETDAEVENCVNTILEENEEELNQTLDNIDISTMF